MIPDRPSVWTKILRRLLRGAFVRSPMRPRWFISVGSLGLILLASLLLASTPNYSFAQQGQQLELKLEIPYFFDFNFRMQSDEQTIIGGGSGAAGTYTGLLTVTNSGSSLENIVIEVRVPQPLSLASVSSPATKTSDNIATNRIAKLETDKSATLRFIIKVPNTDTESKVTFLGRVLTTDGRELSSANFDRPYVPPPFWPYLAFFGVAVVVVGAMTYLVKTGRLWGRSFKTRDIVYMSIFGVLMAAWVNIIGRQLGFFTLTNSVPIPFVNYALGDVGFSAIIVLAILVVRKPGMATGTFLIYEILNEILFFGIDPRWWLRAFSYGIPIDLWVAVTGKLPAFQAAVTSLKPRLIGFFDAAFIGVIRPFFFWLFTDFVFNPFLNHFYVVAYVFWARTIALMLLSIIYGGVIAYPLSLTVRRAVAV